MRNKKLELEYSGPGKWKTSDGRFAVVKRMLADEPWKVTENWKIRFEYSIHNLVGYKGPFEFVELAPEVGRVQAQKDVFPWLGRFTGEGSFELGNPEKMTHNGDENANLKSETIEFLFNVLQAETSNKELRVSFKNNILEEVFGN